eukprot:TRINITY_DN9921_c0_g1_i1.p1 TRINITY_DN9921_c0_g1~~TRINITY_DN9921_c0_g1_i1.p1  ORF type:complete len:336 (-),score=49.93 TRINITY_DN9921_c0_g1_i1:21-1028(-)
MLGKCTLILAAITLILALLYHNTPLKEEYHSKQSLFAPQSPQYYIINKFGYYIYYHQWTSPEKPKAIIFMMHDIGMHSNNLDMDNLCCGLRDHGYHVFSVDMQGHGRSNGERGFFNNLQEAENDLLEIIGLVLQRYEDHTPYFLYGHGLGALAVADLAQFTIKYGFEGVVLSNIDIVLRYRDFPLNYVYPLLSHFLPKAIVPNSRFNFENITANVTAQKLIDKDFLYHRGDFPARTLWSIEYTKIELLKRLDTIKWPALILHGQESTWSFTNSVMLYNEISSSEKTLKVYRDRSMLYLEDPDRVINDVIEWLDEHYTAGHVRMAFFYEENGEPYV